MTVKENKDTLDAMSTLVGNLADIVHELVLRSKATEMYFDYIQRVVNNLAHTIKLIIDTVNGLTKLPAELEKNYQTIKREAKMIEENKSEPVELTDFAEFKLYIEEEDED